MFRITASEAQSIAYNKHNITDQQLMESKLERVYESIQKSANKGGYNTKVALYSFSNELKHFLRSSLESDGYKVKFSGDVYVYDEIVVSWRNS